MPSRFKNRKLRKQQREIERNSNSLGHLPKVGYGPSSSVSVVIPFSDTGCEYRKTSFEFIKNKWKKTYPDWEIVVGKCSTKEWRKGLAVSDGIEKASGDIVIVSDSDVWVEGVEKSLIYLKSFHFIKPFNFLVRANEYCTQRIFSGELHTYSDELETNKILWERTPNRKEYAYRHLGGMYIASRVAALRVPMDPRFSYWGGEDISLAYAVRSLLGPFKIDKNRMIHFWHPPEPGARDIIYSNGTNVELKRSYKLGIDEPKTTKQLISDGKKWRRFERAKVSQKHTKIPKIIHQVWVGDQTKKPVQYMETWKVPGWEYRLWTEKEIDSLSLYNQELYDFYYNRGMYYGCSDVARLEILERYGGVYIDADTERLEDISELLECEFFAVEANLEDRVANGIMGSIPNHPIIVNYIEGMKHAEKVTPPWSTIGGTMFTEKIKNYIRVSGARGVSILKPHTFYPFDSKGNPSRTSGKVFARHFWGSTKSSGYSYTGQNDTRAIIIAGGEATRWKNHLGVPKHLIEIEGETILSRTARLLKENGISSIYVATKEYDPRYDVPYATQVVVDVDYEKNADVDKFLSSKHLWNFDGRTLVVYGDCYYTEEAISTIVKYPEKKWTLFCRPHASKITGTNYGECFVQSFYPEHIEEHEAALHKVAELQKSGELKKGGGWHHYRVMVGLPPDKHAMRDRYVCIDDWTDDFDFPSDYEKWITRRREAGIVLNTEITEKVKPVNKTPIIKRKMTLQHLLPIQRKLG